MTVFPNIPGIKALKKTRSSIPAQMFFQQDSMNAMEY
jgi:hypothetical protein